MVLGKGPNAAVRRWGGLLAGRYQKNNSEAKDFTTTHLGYDTDNGAFYYCEWVLRVLCRHVGGSEDTRSGVSSVECQVRAMGVYDAIADCTVSSTH